MNQVDDQQVVIVDSLATLKQDDGSDCVDNMEIAFKGGKLVCQ